jgi:hypothetical protein
MHLTGAYTYVYYSIPLGECYTKIVEIDDQNISALMSPKLSRSQIWCQGKVIACVNRGLDVCTVSCGVLIVQPWE